MTRRFFSDFAGFGPGGERSRQEDRSPAFIENWIELLHDRGRDECTIFADASRDERSAVLALGAIALSSRTASDRFPPAWNEAVHALECQYDDSSIEPWRAAQSAIARLEQPVAERITQRVRDYLRGFGDDLTRNRSLLELLVSLDELDSLLLARTSLARWMETREEQPTTDGQAELPAVVAVARWVAYQGDRLDGTEEWFKVRAETLSEEARMVANLSVHASTPADRAFAAACSWILTAVASGRHLEDLEVTDFTEQQLSLLARSYPIDRNSSAQSVIAHIGPTLSASGSMAHPGLLACRAMSLWTQPKLAAAATSHQVTPSIGMSWACPTSGAVFESSSLADDKPEFVSLLCFDASGNRCRAHDGKPLRWLGAEAVVKDGVARIATRDLRTAGTVEEFFRDATAVTVGGIEWRYRPSSADGTDA